MSVLVVGSIALDSIRTPWAQRSKLLGGSASYASVAASLFAPVKLVGVVGTDFPARFINLFKRRGIDLSGLSVAPGKTFAWEGEYEENMNRRHTLRTELGVFEGFSPVLSENHRTCRVCLLANISPSLQLQVLEQVESPPVVIADTMDLWINTARKELLRLLKRVHVFILNDSEIQQLTETHNLIAAVKRLHRLGPRFVIVKKGEHGALLSGPNGIFVAPAYPLAKVLDPTGAGDTFAGTVAGYLSQISRLNQGELRKAILYGTAVASFCCEGFGLSKLVRVTPQKIERRVIELQQIMWV